jgi:hypothetical protein
VPARPVIGITLFRPEVIVIEYSPPKSQIWGHEVGRLAAGVVVERALRFLDAHCIVIDPPPQPSELKQLLDAAAKMDAGAPVDPVSPISVMWEFMWRDDSPPAQPQEARGGVFGVHLSRPHRITTMFSFRDMEHYSLIKESLKDLGLVQLSDRHLRPKSERGAKRRAK